MSQLRHRNLKTTILWITLGILFIAMIAVVGKQTLRVPGQVSWLKQPKPTTAINPISL